MTDLLAAVAAFQASVVVDLSVLLGLIDESDTRHDGAVEGTEEGQYEPGSKEIFKSAIDDAKMVAADTTASQEEINQAVGDLAMALAVFQSKMVPVSPLTVFSDIPYYGDFLNYTVNTKTLWEVTEEGENVIVGMHDYATTSGQYMLINDSTFDHFEITFKAKAIAGPYPNDIMIVFGCHDKDNYSYAKLSSEVNESGVFTRIGGPTKFSWVLDDYETYAIEDFDWNEYKMTSLDSVITILRNGEELFSIGPRDSIRYTGLLGVGTYYRNRAYFDDISVSRLVSVVGLEDRAGEGFMLYPNPAGDHLTLEYEAGIKSLAFIDILGHTVKMIGHPPGNRMMINLDGFETGLYLVRYIGTDGRSRTCRFIRQ